MSGKTGGRRAYDAWWATAEGVPRHPDVTYDQDGAAWEAAAAAGAAAARERAAELVTEGNELRGLVTDIIDYLECMHLMPRADDDLIPEWRHRAGLPIAPAVVTAGTEHLVPVIRGLAIGAEDAP